MKRQRSLSPLRTPLFSKPSSESDPENSMNMDRATKIFDIELDPAGEIEAARFNLFDLSSSLPAFHAASEKAECTLRPEEGDPEVFNLKHILEAVNVDQQKKDQGGPGKKNRRKKRAKSDLEFRKGRQEQNIRGGRERNGGQVREDEAQKRRQLAKKIASSDIFRRQAFSMEKDASVSTTAWHGRMMAKAEMLAWRESYSRGDIKEIVATFTPIYFTGKPAMLLDSEGRLFAYRSEVAEFLNNPEAEQDFYAAITRLLHHILENKAIAKACAGAPRGDHLPFIMGHMRQYVPVPCLTQWHEENKDLVNEFISTRIVQRATGYVNRAVEVMFPGVAARLRESAAWHKDKYQFKPLFGLFWCLCINGLFTGQERIHCEPHIDFKNIVGICALLIYQLPNFKFDHTKRCWIVLWEAGVAIQLPPWTVLLYPSSLLHHFNIDVHDFQFVTTEGHVQWPTKENSQPINHTDWKGRGSFVYFNQASMYQSSETGYGTVKKAKAAGHSGKTDYGRDVNAAFLTHGTQVPLTSM